MKQCTKCQTAKELTKFYADKRSKDGKQSACKECNNEYALVSYPRSEEERLVRKETRRKIWNKWYEKNGNKTRAQKRQYKKDNIAIVNSSSAKRRASKLFQTPKWLTSLQLDHINLFYETADQLYKDTSVKFDVDHIIPLQGENVSGLHVPWNLQVITAKENGKKSNTVPKCV